MLCLQDSVLGKSSVNAMSLQIIFQPTGILLYKWINFETLTLYKIYYLYNNMYIIRLNVINPHQSIFQ
jgi:hypothetical protein